MPFVVDLLAVVLVAGLAFRGWRWGVASTGLALAGLAVGYPAAYLLHRPVGDLLGRAFDWQPLVAYPLGGMLVLLTVMILAGVARLVLRRGRDQPPVLPSRIGGAALGAAHGLFLVVLLAGALQMRSAVSPGLDVASSFSCRMAVPFWQLATRVAVRDVSHSNALAATAARFVAEPARTTRGLEKVLADKRLHQLADDPGATGNSPWLVALANDPKFVEAARDAGFLDGAGKGTTAQLAEGLAPLATALRSLSADPELQQLLADPELKAALEQRDVARLLNDPRFNRLAGLVLQRVTVRDEK